MKKAKLYRGIYTDGNGAERIRACGIEEKWYHEDSNYIGAEGIDALLTKGKLTLEDGKSKGEKHKIIYAVANIEDAIFYARRNEKGAWPVLTPGKKELCNNPLRKEECACYIVEFETDFNNIYIDPNDFLYPMCYKAEKWGNNKEIMEKLFSTKIINKYLPLLNNEQFDNTALGAIMSNEPEAIKAFYKNKDILIKGKCGTQFFSAFKVNDIISSDKIISVKKVEDISLVSRVPKYTISYNI